MIRVHPENCTCDCHADPGEKRMGVVFLQKDDAALRRCFSHAVLVGFTSPNGLWCRDCGQHYGYYGHNPVTAQLRPIEGNRTHGLHPGSIAASRLAPVARLGWEVANWLTPASAPVWLQEKIRDGINPPTWEIVTVWTMDD